MFKNDKNFKGTKLSESITLQPNKESIGVVKENYFWENRWG